MRSKYVSKPVVVLTRSHEGNAELASILDFGLGVVRVDTVEFLPPENWTVFDRAVGRLDEFDWVVFTSPRAVRSFSERLEALGRPSEGPRYASVGPSTSEEMTRRGIPSDFTPEEYLTSNLAKELPAHRGERILLCRADIASEELDEILRTRGCHVTSLTAYVNVRVAGKVADEELADARFLLFASPSEVSGLVGRLSGDALATLRKETVAVCIGPVTAERAKKSGFQRLAVAKVHTIRGLADELRRQIEIA